MKPTLFISATILAVLLAAAAADVSHAHGGGLTEVVDPSTGLTTQGCAEQNAHYSVGRYVSYFYAVSDHLHVGSGGGVSAISVTRLRQNPFLYAGYHYDVFGEHYDEYVEWYEEIPDGYTGFRIEYNTTRATGAVVVICYEVITSDEFQYQAGMFHPLRIGGPSGATNVAPPPGQQGSPGASGQSSNGAPTLTGDTTIHYAENGAEPVARYTATDPENSQIIWTLSGADGTGFSIIQGELTFNARPDYEDPTDADGNNVHQVRVEASDGASTATLDVIVPVTDVNESPEFPYSEATRSVAENIGIGQSVGTPVEAIDPENDILTYSLGGIDAASFSVDAGTGQLKTKAPLDYEAKNRYSVTVTATDSDDHSASVGVTVEVTNVDEPGSVTLSTNSPRVGTRLKATLTDPDGNVSGATWSWERSSDKSAWSDVSNGASNVYTPAADDLEKYLRATVSYTDGHGSGKSAEAVSDSQVRPRAASSTVAPQPVNNPPTLAGNTAIEYAESDTGPVATYTATDPDNDQIIWDLSGTDGADFSIIRGDLTFNAGPDYEDPTDANTDNVYHVTVEASDGTNTAALAVTVTVTNVNEPPEFPGDATTRSVPEDTAAGEDVGAPVEATDPEGDSLTYQLGGTDASSFDIATSSGQLLTRAALDNSSYSVTVSVTDGRNADGNSDTGTDDAIDVTITVSSDGSSSTSSETTLLQPIPRQFIPINGGARQILLSDYFSDTDDDYPPYRVTISDSAIATVEVSEGYLTITPQSIGVATTTVTVSDSLDVRDEFKVVVYRPVVPRTNTETVHIIDPAIQTTLTSSDGSLTVTLPANNRDQFFQAAIDALSNDCGSQSPVDEQRLCVLVDLFDLGAESIEESLDVAATLSVTLDQQQYNTVQTDLDNGDFTMWKGHGPSDTSWDQIPQCEEPRGSSECFSLVQTSNGGKITVYNISAFSRFDAGLLASDPTPQPPPTKPSPPTTLPDSSGGSDSGTASRNDDHVYRSTPSINIAGPVLVDYAENGSDPIARYTIEETDVGEIFWSVYGERRPFTISADGVLSFKTPPDYENLSTLEGDTYWVQIHAEAPGSARKDDVLNVYVTVTQVNEIGAISGDSELSVQENHTGAIARYRLDDPENGVVSWSLTGADAHGFEIDEQGNLSPVDVFDFEAPASSLGTNVHSLTITATDDGEPALSSQVDVLVTVDDVNEAPVAARAIPAVDLTTERVPWTLDLDEFFTDPDGDLLTYGIVGESNPDVAVAAIEDGTLTIAPVSGGSVSLEVGATDPGGLRAASAVSVSVRDTTPVATPVPAKVTEPAPAKTPEPVIPVVETTEPSPAELPPPLSERRYRDMTQQLEGVSKVIVGFAVKPVVAPQPDLELPPLEPTPRPAGSLRDDEPVTEAGYETALPVEAGEVGGGLSLWLMVLLCLLGLGWVVYTVRLVVIHRVSLSIWQELSRLRWKRPT